MTAAVRRAHEDAFGPHRVTRWQPSMATEDIARSGDAGLDLHGVPGIRTGYWMVGGTGPRQWAAAGEADAARRPAALPSTTRRCSSRTPGWRWRAASRR